MTTHAGNIAFASLTIPEPTNPDFGHLVEPDYQTGILKTYVLFGSTASNQPTAELANTHNGNQSPAFAFLDFYNRIHISATLLDLGNVISIQERSISVWNAYFVPHTLLDIVAVDDVDLILTEPAPTPLVYAPLQEFIYTLSADTNGPPTIDATYTFEFDVRDFDLNVIGVRIVAWYWEANWIQPVVERLEWLTDLIENYDGSEQRRALKGFPRITYEFTYDVADGERRTIENILYAWGGRIFALPIWTDVETMTVELLAGETVIPVETAGRDFHVDGLAIFINDLNKFESVEVESIAAQSITIKRPLVASWGIGARFYPARTAKMLDGRGYGRMTRNYVRGLARFKTVQEIEAPALVEAQYRNLPVMEVKPNWREAPEIDYLRKMVERSFGTGRDDSIDEAQLPLPAHSFRWTMLNRDEIIYFRKWLYARAGRQKAIWLPTWSDDLILADEIAPSSQLMDLQACGLVHFAAGDIHRRDIRIELVDGAIYYRRIEGFVTVDAETERVTMNAPFGFVLTPAMVESISWMHLARLNSDQMEITWQHAGVAEAALIMKAPRNDV